MSRRQFLSDLDGFKWWRIIPGDHNGATFYQHKRFLEVVRANRKIEVSLDDGIWAVRMGMAAQKSARTGQDVRLRPHD